jgi:hypothetical protein
VFIKPVSGKGDSGVANGEYKKSNHKLKHWEVSDLDKGQEEEESKNTSEH